MKNIIEILKKNPIQIENFLELDVANSIYEIIEDKAVWDIISTTKGTYTDEIQKNKNKEFSFWFSVNTNEKLLKKCLLNSNFFIELIKLFNNEYLEFDKESPHLSMFKFGNFLSPHNDINGVRKYAFIYNLTKDAEEHKGGCLKFINKKNEIVFSFPPIFNSLTIFDVYNTPYEHLVTEVIDKNYSRYAISGWLVDAEKSVKIKKTML